MTFMDKQEKKSTKMNLPVATIIAAAARIEFRRPVATEVESQCWRT